MPAAPTIAVTGVTGHVGAGVLKALAPDALPLRLIVRDPSRLQTDRYEVAEASYGDREKALAALQGVELLFMISASESADRLQQHLTFIDAAAEAGVRHVVYTSFLHASPEAAFTLGREHWATEQHLRASGMAWTFLRDSFYLDFLPSLAGEDGVIRGPAGQGRVSAVAREDVSRCAAAILREPGPHQNRTYDLTGPEALTLEEAAAIITEVTGRKVRYHEETVEEAYASRRVYNAPDWQLDAWVSTYVAIAQGELRTRSDDVQRLTGRPPLSLRELLASD